MDKAGTRWTMVAVLCLATIAAAGVPHSTVAATPAIEWIAPDSLEARAIAAARMTSSPSTVPDAVSGPAGCAARQVSTAHQTITPIAARATSAIAGRGGCRRWMDGAGRAVISHPAHSNPDDREAGKSAGCPVGRRGRLALRDQRQPDRPGDRLGHSEGERRSALG